MNFEEARRAMINHYQWVVVHDFLPRVLHPDYADAVLNATSNKFFKPSNPHDPNLPIEWAVAGYRFGHSMVRQAYRIVLAGPFVPVFDGTEGDLTGDRPIPADRRIHWPNFVQIDGFLRTHQHQPQDRRAPVPRAVPTAGPGRDPGLGRTRSPAATSSALSATSYRPGRPSPAPSASRF